MDMLILMTKTKTSSIAERFMKYRKSVSEKTKSMGLDTAKKKSVQIPEIVYPSDYDVQEELSNMSGYRKF